MRIHFVKQLFTHFSINTVELSNFVRVAVFNAPTVADMINNVNKLAVFE